MNKNTRQAKKLKLTNANTTTSGTGVSRRIVERHADPIFEGRECDCRRPAGKNKYQGAQKAEKFMGQGKGS